MKFIFFGTSLFSVYVLNELKSTGFVPFYIVTFPDRPKGRKMIQTPNVVKIWAQVNNIPILETLSLKTDVIFHKLKELEADLFIVASFGRILPENVIYLPKYKTLNVHPSLLPRLRGPSPIQEAILSEDKTGVSIMRLDTGVDTGPILAQVEVSINNWPIYYKEAEEILGKAGGNLLAEIIPLWINEKLKEVAQNESLSTHTRLIKRTDGNIEFDSPEDALRKIKAFEVWPRTFKFFKTKEGRNELLIIKTAKIENNELVPLIVIPAGRKEMKFDDYLRGR
ncbi:MAG: methionyl-tRNA formyltransferase [bacterium]|nr:methionyl-tRNA formyltransferase [bacterium]